MRHLKIVAVSGLPYALLALFFAVSITFRPLLPIDETRYLSVAWEMYLRHNFFVPTLNFEPYFQKPPLLFWLIDLGWWLFGVGRGSALIVIFAISSSAIYLTQRLAKLLFADVKEIEERAPWLLLGNVAFIIYSSLVLFDLLLTVFVLAAFCALIDFSKDGNRRHAVLAGLFIGLGILTKGPVTLIHIGPPIMLYSLWRDPQSSIPVRTFFARLPLVFLTCLIPVALWLGPAVYQVGEQFAHNLIWQQAVGRVSGTLENAHSRPIYFYLLVLPVALLPWVGSPHLWRSVSWLHLNRSFAAPHHRRLLSFLALWCALVFIVFSLIAGKQPHYLVPMLPPVTLIFAYLMAKVRFSLFPYTAVSLLVLFAAVQIIASTFFFPRYDLKDIAQFVADRPNAEWAYRGQYQGQLTFLARLKKPFAIVRTETDRWLKAHPAGYLIVSEPHYPENDTRVVFSHRGEKGYLIVLGGAEVMKPEIGSVRIGPKLDSSLSYQAQGIASIQ